MVNKEDIPQVGAKVEIILEDIFGNPYSEIGKITKEPYQHGYHCGSGGWCLYPSDGDIPCFKIWFTPARCRKPRVLDVKRIVSLRVIVP